MGSKIGETHHHHWENGRTWCEVCVCLRLTSPAHWSECFSYQSLLDLSGWRFSFMLIVFHPNIWKLVPNTDFYNFSLRLEPPCSDGLVKIWLKSTWDGPCFPFCFSHLTWAAKTFQEKDLQSTNWIKLSSTGLPMRKTTVNTQPQRVWLMVRVILKLPANCSRRGREHSNWFVRTFRTCCDLLCYRWLYLQTL